MKTHLAIFDLDGTLFCTKRVNYLAYKTALEEVGCTLEYDYFLTRCDSRPYRKFLPALVKESGQTEQVHERKKALYKSFLAEAQVNEGLFTLLECLRPTHYTAIVTTGSRENVQDILAAFGKEACFDYLLTQEDIPKKKPDPQGFLMAMEHFGVSPESTVIFEDSAVGLAAAEKSGATVFAAKGYN